ncbi:MAG: hypothetical protein ACYC2H_08270 [Thermoplasmatota archaeon]
MNRILLTSAGLLVLLPPLASALVDPFPAPEPLPSWTPTDATGYGVGIGSLVSESCPQTFTVGLVMWNRTTFGGPGAWKSAYTRIGSDEFLACATSGGSPGPWQEATAFYPETGGCFGDSDLLCLTFVSEESGVYTYDAYMVNYRGPDDIEAFNGEVRVTFVDPLPDL